MPGGLSRIGLSSFVAAIAAALLVPASARASVTTLPLAVYGFASGVTVAGTDPHFDLYVPDYPGARSMDVRFALGFSAIVDGHSVVTVTVDGEPVGTSTVAALRSGATAGGIFRRFQGKGRMLTVSVEAHLDVPGQRCHEYDPRSLWMRVMPESRIAVDRSDVPPATAAQFFENYDGRYAVTSAPGASDEIRRASLGLAYWVHQLERWRNVELTYGSAGAAPVRTIVVGESKADLEVRGDTLYATPRGLSLLLVRAAPGVIVKTGNGYSTIKERAMHSPVTFDALGLGTRTQRGSGDLHFLVPFALGTFGGLPHALHLHLELAHGAYERGDRAAMTVLLNGAVVNGFGLSQSGGTQRFDVPIDERRLGAANTIDVAVEYVPQGCARSSMSVSVLGTSSFAWSGVAQYPPTVGEFFNEATGTLGVGISDPKLDGAAFRLLDRLGSIDPNLSRIVVSAYDGKPLESVREAVYVSSPEALKEVPISWDPKTGELRLSDDAGKTVFSAQLGSAYGQMRAFRAAVPSLAVTYTKSDSPQVLDSIGALSPGQLSSANTDLLLFDARGVVYQSPPNAVIKARTPRSPLRSSWPLFVGFAAIIIVALILVARRARKVS